MLKIKTYLEPFFVAAACSVFATGYLIMGGPHANFLADLLINPKSLLPAVSLYVALLGLIAVAAAPKKGVLRKFVETAAPIAIRAFSSLSGSITGWGLTICVAHPFLVGMHGLLLATQVAVVLAFITVGGFYGYAVLVPIYNENTGLRFTARKGEFARVVLGTALVLYGLTFFILWFLFD